ncbi:MAG: hypothetical protein KatS3mg104_3100 [Phycisphaerae bacterium]|nr:MAG: hypothetical protein KatS3mg104_3100 [Phycisphaerae bacterium]
MSDGDRSCGKGSAITGCRYVGSDQAVDERRFAGAGSSHDGHNGGIGRVSGQMKQHRRQILTGFVRKGGVQLPHRISKSGQFFLQLV